MKTNSVEADGQYHVWNEDLCYVFNHVLNSTCKSLVKCITDFYRPSEVVTARELLWHWYESFLNEQARKTHRTQQPTSKEAAKAWAEDICSRVSLLVDSHIDELGTVFYAVSLKSVPPCSPKEVITFSLAAREAELERKAEANAAVDFSVIGSLLS